AETGKSNGTGRGARQTRRSLGCRASRAPAGPRAARNARASADALVRGAPHNDQPPKPCTDARTSALMTNPSADPVRDNPLLADTGLPRFDLIRPEHVEPALRRPLAAQRAANDDAAPLEQPGPDWLARAERS